ncbi:uncharacterized protein FIESC28_10010 [Fusarium coffeatum]|uniref:DUF6536 domain-containing protein n=1 Tax=Fusarium coffeatum TaxID=231269 RepID=A0A366QYJ6_9HYPO|nr:uncharacterized protein FIESC28_10010 [Fusarium coffeatum]RBR09070.1 hypothetical protein FIESC28_10010 [Fusarium coffeatum]
MSETHNDSSPAEREEEHLLSPLRSDRFANTAYLSQYIPELDPNSARAKTFRTKMAKRSAMLKIQMASAFSVVTISSAVLLWAILSYPPDDRGVGTFLVGNCSTASTINTAIHGLINVISSLFLGAGNYCIWNATIFTSLPIIAIPRAMVTSDFQTAGDNWTATDPLRNDHRWWPPSDDDAAQLGISSLYGLQSQAANFTRLDRKACMKGFLNPLESTRSVLIVSSNVTSTRNNGSSLIDGWVTPWETYWSWSNGWICERSQKDTNNLRYCTLEWAESFADDWTVGEVRSALQHDRLGIVCVCTLFESLMVVWTWHQYRRSSKDPDSKKARRTMITMGDAIHSFLERPVPDGFSLMDTDVKEGGIIVCNVVWKLHLHIPWSKAVSKRVWIISVLLFSCGIIGCAYPVWSSYQHLIRIGVDHADIWSRGFGIHPASSSNDLGPLGATINKSKTGTRLANIIIANSPQVLVSFLYIFCNNILTRQVVADEWVRYLEPDGKKVLRVSSPEGMQRSSYFLSLPLKYSVTLMILSMTLHWLVSQSMFFVQTSQFGPGKDGKRLPYFDESTRGYSTLGSILALSLAFIMVLLLIVNSICRKYRDIPKEFQQMGFNSRALQAVCQRQDGDQDARFFPIRLGVSPSDGDQIPRLIFSTDIRLQTPEPGHRYLHPVFVHGVRDTYPLMEGTKKVAVTLWMHVVKLWEKLVLAIRGIQGFHYGRPGGAA